MKIGIDASRYRHDTATGVEWYSYHITNGIIGEALKRELNEVVLYAPREFKIPKELEHPRKIRKRILPARRLWTLWKLSMEMRKNPPDVLFVPAHTLPLIRPAFSVVTIHDTAFRYLKKSYSRFAYWHLNWSTKYAVKHASKIIVPSSATKQDLVQLFKCPTDKIVVVPHGFKKNKHLDEDKVSENLEYFGFDGKENPYVFFVGRLESKKNLAKLVEAFATFVKDHPEWRLVLAGKRGVGFEEILDKVRELKISEKVLMPGYVDEQEKAYLYKNCSVFAFPSLYEGFGFPILEAFTYKKPVLTSHVSSMPEVAGDAALYCDPFDASSIARGLDKLASDKDYANELVEKGLGRLDEFTWEKAVKKTYDVLSK
ncbi:glycosyltransferase family 4 protein [Candidatus Peregrinibacteria bacterium]|jgi:glycosyltransferase involved in cell wall biosynthesis|nr:glycosyltransferase family 4 protein [Candidatus Peregrinibacteria bacterium]